MDDILIDKFESIKRCLKRVEQEYYPNQDTFTTNFTIQDAVILNLLKASQLSIDIAAHIIRLKKFEIPKTNREFFVILENNKIISEKTSISMQKMVGFRNIAVHDYNNLNIDIVINIVENHLNDFLQYMDEIKKNLS
jgi:uncharacterized protein YutE (UPF0331/DUF86 family)